MKSMQDITYRELFSIQLPVINSSGHKAEIRAVEDMLLFEVEQKIASLFPESLYIITITELF